MDSRRWKRVGFPASAVVSCLLAVASHLLAEDSRPADEGSIPWLRADAVVPSREFLTIQAAINAVGNGGSIFVRPGVYREQLTIAHKQIRLTGSGPGRTEIAAPRSTAVDDHSRAVGLVTYLEGGGGVIEGLSLRGGLNGIVGHEPSATSTEPSLSNSLLVRNIVISDTGRAILWHAPADLTIHEVSATNLRHNGIVFAPLAAGGATRGEGRLNALKVNLTGLAFFGVLVVNAPSIGCQNQLSDVNVLLASGGGIGVIRSGLCIFGGTLSLNRGSGIYLQQSAAIIDGSSIQSTIPLTDGSWGDGISSFLSEIVVTNAFVNLSARAGLSVFGGSAGLAANTFNCYAFPFQLDPLLAGYFGPSEPPADDPGILEDLGGNLCGCGQVEEMCRSVSAGGPQPPPPIVL
jgi:hypothetical protein